MGPELVPLDVHVRVPGQSRGGVAKVWQAHNDGVESPLEGEHLVEPSNGFLLDLFWQLFNGFFVCVEMVEVPEWVQVVYLFLYELWSVLKIVDDGLSGVNKAILNVLESIMEWITIMLALVRQE